MIIINGKKRRTLDSPFFYARDSCFLKSWNDHMNKEDRVNRPLACQEPDYGNPAAHVVRPFNERM